MIALDVIARPSWRGLAYRAAQLERDRARLLDRLEREELIDVTPLDHVHRISARTFHRLPQPPRPE